MGHVPVPQTLLLYHIHEIHAVWGKGRVGKVSDEGDIKELRIRMWDF